MSKFLGIDTSCYTTSLAVYDSEKGLICEERIILKVKMGGRGLSQSNMVYQHVRNLPVLMQRISPSLGDVSVIGVSSFPRRRADSFMPAFLVGKGLADSLSAAVHIPMYQFSHQENHALSAIREAPELWGKDFYLMHLSGGTQDVLRCAWKQNKIEIQELITTRYYRRAADRPDRSCSGAAVSRGEAFGNTCHGRKRQELCFAYD